MNARALVKRDWRTSKPYKKGSAVHVLPPPPPPPTPSTCVRGGAFYATKAIDSDTSMVYGSNVAHFWKWKSTDSPSASAEDHAP